MKTNKVVLVLLLALVGIATVVGVTTVQRRIANRGVVHIVTIGLDVFRDLGCTDPAIDLNWGTLEPGDTAAKTLYAKSTGNTAIVLSMTTENWFPTAAGTFITVVWDAEGMTLNPGDVTPVSLGIAIAPDVSGITDFNFDIVLVGDET